MLSTIIVICTLLVIASLIHHLAKMMKVPYTILLFIVWMLLVPINTFFGRNMVETLSLTPELLFFVFLPVLIFEAGYHIKYKQLTKNYATIWTLAILWLIISTAIVWGWGRYILNALGITIPIEVMLLFGVIISSTDPVAVLAIFKDLWVPKKLGLIFEGESLFNDGIAVAVFLVMIEIIRKGNFWAGSVWSGIGDFLMMVIWGIILGTVLWLLFSSVIKHIRNNEHVEITLTMVLAHVVFLIAEYVTHVVSFDWFDPKISGVIATAYAAIIMGNYGKTKISPKVEAYMDKFWSFFSFVTNSLVFILMGMMVKFIGLSQEILLPSILVIIALLIVWRALAVYLPIGLVNFFRKNKQQNIPKKRQHLLARWSLRWALWLMLVLLIPDSFLVPWWTYDFTPKAYILALTILAIMFSLIIRWLTIKPLIKKLNIGGLADLEEFELLESHILVYNRIIKKIESMTTAYKISPGQSESLIQKYQSKMDESNLQMQLFLQQQPNADQLVSKALSLHALGIEKEYLHEMFSYNEISESIYASRSAKIETQGARIEAGNNQIRWFKSSTDIRPQSRYPIERIMYWLTKCDQDDEHNEYIISRAKYIITENVIGDLKSLMEIDFWYDQKHLSKVIKLYESFHQNAHDEMQEYGAKDEDFANSINEHLLNKSIIKSEEQLIEELYHKDMITQKIYQQFVQEMDDEIWRKH